MASIFCGLVSFPNQGNPAILFTGSSLLIQWSKKELRNIEERQRIHFVTILFPVDTILLLDSIRDHHSPELLIWHVYWHRVIVKDAIYFLLPYSSNRKEILRCPQTLGKKNKKGGKWWSVIIWAQRDQILILKRLFLLKNYSCLVYFFFSSLA